MPQRPTKKVKEQRNAKPGAAKSDYGSQQRRRDGTTKAILGKFQGRKSI